MVVWDEELLGYDLGDHPLDPVRVELTIALARALGVLDRPGVTVVAPGAGRRRRADPGAPTRPTSRPCRPRRTTRSSPATGLGTPDNPVFDRMHEASALVAGRHPGRGRGGVARRGAARGQHRRRAAPRDAGPASGFCVYNDPAVAIARLLDLGAERVAYVDVDVHHGDGVQADLLGRPAGADDQPARDAAGAVPGHRVSRTRPAGRAPRAARSTWRCRRAPDDAGWLRAFHAVVPPVLRAFRPQILVTQCGADTHRLDPLADLRLTVDGQRASYLALRALADELCDGRWVATGGGGYALVEAVPRAWTHLLAIATGEPLDPATPTPPGWRALAAAPADCPARARVAACRMTDGGEPTFTPWQPASGDAVDRAILATRRAVFPLLGLDPYDPRD